jgi:hypothetical protein
MSVKPHEGPEGSVFTFKGRSWRPNRRVTATFGVYCRPGEACTQKRRDGRLVRRSPRYHVIVPGQQS